MIKIYMVDDRPIEVSSENEKQFKKDFPNAKLKSKKEPNDIETSPSQKSPKQKTYTVDDKPVKVSVEDEKSFLKDFPQSKTSGFNSSKNNTGVKKYSIGNDLKSKDFKSGDELMKMLDGNPSYYDKIKSGELKLDIQNDSELSEKIDKEMNKGFFGKTMRKHGDDPLSVLGSGAERFALTVATGGLYDAKKGLDGIMSSFFPPPTHGDTYDNAMSPELNSSIYDENGAVKEDVLNSVVDIANDTTFNPFKKGKEGRVVDALNKLFEGQSDIKFREAHAGRNAVKIDIGDAKDEIEFELSGMESGLQELTAGQILSSDVDPQVIKDMFAHIKRKTSSDARDSHDSEIYQLVKDCKHLEGDASNYHRASFADCIDASLGKEKYQSNVDNKLPGTEPKGRLYKNIIEAGDDVIRKANPASWIPNLLIGADQEDIDNKDVTASELARNIIPGMDYDDHHVDMTGSVKLSDGTEVSYKYLYDNRNDFRAYKVGDYNVNNKTRLEEIHGGADGHDNHLDRNAVVLLGQEDKEIVNLREKLELAELGKTTNDNGQSIDIPEDVNQEELVSDLKNKIKKRVKSQGYDKAKLYDESGKYLKFKELKWVQSEFNPNKMIQLDSNGVPNGEERDLNETDKMNSEVNQRAGELADMTDLDKLKELRREFHVELVSQMQLAHENIDIAEDGLAFWQNPDFVNIFDQAKDSFDNDKRQLSRAYENGDIFNVGGEDDGYGNAISSWLNPLDWSSSDDKIDPNRLTNLAGGSNVSTRFNEALKNYRIVNKAIEMNVDPRETKMGSGIFGGKDPFLVGQVLDGLSKSFTGENITNSSEDLSHEDIAQGFEHIMQAEGYDVPELVNNGWHNRGSKARHITNLATNTVTELAPLLAEIAIFKKLGGMTALNKGIEGAGRFALNRAGLSGMTTGVQLHTSGGRIRSLANRFAGKSSSKWYKDIATKIIQPALVTTAEWSIAEGVGEAIMADGSGLYDGHTLHFDKETGAAKFNPIFPMAMGAAGGVFGMGMKGFKNNILKPWVEKGGPRAQLYLRAMDGEVGGKIFQNLIQNKTAGWIGGVAGQAGVATGLLTVAGVADQVNKDIKNGYWPWHDSDPNTPEGKQRLEEWQALTDRDHLVGTFIAMAAIGLNPGGAAGRKKWNQLGKAIKQDVARLKVDTVESRDARKFFEKEGNEFNKENDGTYDNKEIDKAMESTADKISKEITKTKKDKKLTEEQKKTKIDELKTKLVTARQHRQTLKSRNELIAAKKALVSSNRYDKYLKDRYMIADAVRGGNLKGSDIEKFAEMTREELEMWFDSKGIDHKSKEADLYNVVFAHVKQAKMQVDAAKIHGDPVAKNKLLELSYNLGMNKGMQAAIDKAIKENPEKKSTLENQKKKLTEKEKQITEELDIVFEKFKGSFEKILDAQIAHSKLVAEQLGKKFEVVDNKAWLELIKNGTIPRGGIFAEGAITEDGSIYINREAAIRTRNLNTANHELMHRILKNQLKEQVWTVDGKKYTKKDLDRLAKSSKKSDQKLLKEINKTESELVLSENGMKTIDLMLSHLTKQERAIIEDRINENYKYKKITEMAVVDGKVRIKTTNTKYENKKEDYYEEYITVLGDAIRNGEIKRSNEVGRKLGNTIYPMLRKTHPNLYRFDLNTTNSKKAATDLFRFIEEFNSDKITKHTIKAAKQMYFGGPKGKYQSQRSQSGFNDTRFIDILGPEMKKNTPEIIRENERLYDKVVEDAKKKGIELDASYTETVRNIINEGIPGKERTEYKEVKYYEAVSQRVRDQLVANNYGRVMSLAKVAWEAGQRTGLDGNKLVSFEEFESGYAERLVNLTRTWNPKINPSFGAYMNSILPREYRNILDNTKDKMEAKSMMFGADKKEMDIRSEEAPGIDSKDMTVKVDKQTILTSKFRRQIKMSEEDIDSMLDIVSKSLKESKEPIPGLTPKGEVFTKKYKDQVRKTFEKDVEFITKESERKVNEILKNEKIDPIKKGEFITNEYSKRANLIATEALKMSTVEARGEFKKFDKEFKKNLNTYGYDTFYKMLDLDFTVKNREALVNQMSPERKRKFFGSTKDGTNPFYDWIEKVRNKTSAKKYIGKQLSPMDMVKIQKSGVDVYREKMPTEETWRALFDVPTTKTVIENGRAVKKKDSTKHERRKSLAEAITEATAADAIYSVMKNPKFYNEYLDYKSKYQDQVVAKTALESLLKMYNKKSGVMFSSGKEAGKISGKEIERMMKALDTIESKGAHSVFRFEEGKAFKFENRENSLTRDWKNILSENEAKSLWDVWSSGLVLKDFTKAFAKLQSAVPKGSQRTSGLEMFISKKLSNVDKKFPKEWKDLKLKLVTTSEVGEKHITEDGKTGQSADIMIGLRFGDLPIRKGLNLEQKSEKAQYGRISGGVDAKGNYYTTSKTDGFSADVLNPMIEAFKMSAKGHAALVKRVRQLGRDKNLDLSAAEREAALLFEKTGDLLPDVIIDNFLKPEGLWSNMTSTVTLNHKYLPQYYGGKEIPSVGLVRGAEIWRFPGENTFMLGLPEIISQLDGVVRINRTEKRGTFYSYEGKKYSTSDLSVKNMPDRVLVKEIKTNGVKSTDVKTGFSTYTIAMMPTNLKVLGERGKNILAEDFNLWDSKESLSALEVQQKKAMYSTSKEAFDNLRLTISGKKKGMSTFDFDDTLARTKSGIRTNIPNPDGSPKPGRKVIFLAGGAGSGKGNVVSKLGLEKMGMKIVNQDISLEWLKKNSGLPENMADLTKEQRSTLGKLGHQARGIAKRKMMKFQGKGDGVVIDGTGGSIKNMEKLVNEFKDKGYDTSMLYVETTVKTALERNRARKERSLLDKIVERNHASVQANKPGFKEMFGKRFMEVKTDKLKQEDAMPEKLTKEINDFISGYERRRLDAEQFALEGESILKRGGKFDFSEFNRVIEGTEGPYLKKAMDRAKKYGTEDMFVLTARPAESARSIQEFLKSQGLNIPLKNITGLANSTGNAKALWMLEKFKEGYNDMYFVDDALPNVKAVKTLLEQLDIKSKVVQAKAKFSKSMDAEFNKMLERGSKGKIEAGKVMSLAEARMLGKGKGKFDYFIPPSAEDFRGLMYKQLGRGKQGEADMRFFEEALFKPFAKGIRDLTIVKQKMSEEYKALKKVSKDVKLKEVIEGTPFTVDQAIRLYLWEKAGIEVPDISIEGKQKLVEHVENNPALKAYAEKLSAISRMKNGYIEPGEFWMVENIASDLNQIVKGQTRKNFLQEWIDNKNIIFSKANLNKIEAIHGKEYRDALENMLHRMETGTNRLTGVGDKNVNLWYDWINGSVGATMFWNVRSAMLQTISTVNFTNWAENNPFAQARAFANIPQFSKDFAFIFNSPMLKQRRSGLQIDVSASELTNVFESNGRNPKAVLNYLLQKGFTPTKMADSFAIALGGAPYYRNRIKKYTKEGMSKAKAEEQAWLDFQELAEQTQQSSRPDLISQQQAGPLGRIILAWANTPMQMTRLSKKALSDLVNNRGSKMSNLSRLSYYMAIQNLWFYALQSGLGWMMFGDDQEEAIEKKQISIANGALDTLLRGTGIYGAAASTIKNTILQYRAQKKKGFYGDQGKTIVEVMNVSPPIGTKVRKVYNAIQSWNKYKAREISQEMGLRIENPELHAVANLIEAATNAPLARVVNKANNLEEAITGGHAWWQRAAMILGWNRWNVGAKDEEYEEAKDKVWGKKKKQNKVRCSAMKKSGGRCKNNTSNKSKKCYAHQ